MKKSTAYDKDIIHDINNALIELTFGIHLIDIQTKQSNIDITKPMLDSITLIQNNILTLKRKFDL